MGEGGETQAGSSSEGDWRGQTDGLEEAGGGFEAQDSLRRVAQVLALRGS